VSKVKGSRIEAAGKTGLEAEDKVQSWLENQGYNVTYWHKGKRSNLPYDIIVEKLVS
jgi:hypothetical protein